MFVVNSTKNVRSATEVDIMLKVTPNRWLLSDGIESWFAASRNGGEKAGKNFSCIYSSLLPPHVRLGPFSPCTLHAQTKKEIGPRRRRKLVPPSKLTHLCKNGFLPAKISISRARKEVGHEEDRSLPCPVVKKFVAVQRCLDSVLRGKQFLETRIPIMKCAHTHTHTHTLLISYVKELDFS